MRFRLFGAEIYVSFPFAAVISLMLVTDRTGLILPTLFAVLLHEAAHLFAMWVCGCPPKRIRLIPASVQIVRSASAKRSGEALIAAAGPAANLLLAAAALLEYYFCKNPISAQTGALNLVVGGFNLLPVSGLDGGTLLYCLVSIRHPEYAERTVKIITAVLSAAAFLAGTVLALSGRFNPSIFIVGLYLGVCSFIRL